MMPGRSSLVGLWPTFPPERILVDDGWIVAIDKPEGISTHAPDEGRTDDAFSRLRAYLAEQAGVAEREVYLGIHQRLDRDTSGVLVLARRREANAPLAAQFEGRAVKKVYVAGVARWPAAMREGVLRHVLVREDAERMRVARSPRERGQEAITRYRVLDRRGDRALVELRPETGRTHQIRVQVAATGAAIAGDRVYGDAASGALPSAASLAPRLLLHARELVLEHPRTHRRVALRAPVPDAFDAWLRGDAGDPLRDAGSIERALRKAADARFALGRSRDTTAFRLANLAGDGLEGVAVDVYGDHLLVHLYTREAEAARERVLDAAWALGPRGVYLMVHPKHASVVVDTRTGELAPPHAVRGDDAPSPLVVREGGLAYLVRLGDGLKTGIFLDQRENRRRVRALSAGARVLNLFAYTCAFTVAAAAGGAARTVSIDVTPGVLDWGRENLAANGLDGPAHETLAVDAIPWLAQAAKRGERFDLVLLDPPSFATTRTSRFSAESDYKELARAAFAVLAPGGRMLACTNHRGIARGRFRRHLHEAARLAGREARQAKDLPDPTDFPAPFGAEPHLKSVLVTLP